MLAFVYLHRAAAAEKRLKRISEEKPSEHSNYDTTRLENGSKDDWMKLDEELCASAYTRIFGEQSSSKLADETVAGRKRYKQSPYDLGIAHYYPRGNISSLRCRSAYF